MSIDFPQCPGRSVARPSRADDNDRSPFAVVSPMSQSFAQIRTILQASAFGCVLALTACASLPPPTGEIQLAQQAVVRAENADADQYAGDELASARTALSAAQAALAAGREQEARVLANRAAALADLAHARSNEATVRAELAQRQAEIEELRQRLRREDGK